MKIYALILIFFLILTFTLPSRVLAVSEHLNLGQLQSMCFTKYESVNGNSLLYPFKRFREKIFRVPDQELFDTRFNELIYIANKKKTGFLEESVSRYISISGILMQNKKSSVSEKAKQNIKILEKLRDGYPANSLPWIQIQKTVDTTRRLQ